MPAAYLVDWELSVFLEHGWNNAFAVRHGTDWQFHDNLNHAVDEQPSFEPQKRALVLRKRWQVCSASPKVGHYHLFISFCSFCTMIPQYHDRSRCRELILKLGINSKAPLGGESPEGNFSNGILTIQRETSFDTCYCKGKFEKGNRWQYKWKWFSSVSVWCFGY